jgi:regulator of sigma E protease
VAVPAWSTFCERVLAAPDKEHHLDHQSARDGRVRSGKFQIRREDFVDQHGQAVSRYVIPMQHWIPLAPDDRVEHPTPVRYAFQKAIEETVDVTRFTLVCIVRLLQGRLSLDSLSGPITIFEIAGEEGRKGPDNFIWVMALLSINLGLLNLLPIPVLDGGHLMFFAIEGVLRKPLPLRLREVAHIVGMAILFGLMAIAFRNDVQKRDVVRAQIGANSG